MRWAVRQGETHSTSNQYHGPILDHINVLHPCVLFAFPLDGQAYGLSEFGIRAPTPHLIAQGYLFCVKQAHLRNSVNMPRRIPKKWSYYLDLAVRSEPETVARPTKMI